MEYHDLKPILYFKYYYRNFKNRIKNCDYK